MPRITLAELPQFRQELAEAGWAVDRLNDFQLLSIVSAYMRYEQPQRSALILEAVKRKLTALEPRAQSARKEYLMLAAERAAEQVEGKDNAG